MKTLSTFGSLALILSVSAAAMAEDVTSPTTPPATTEGAAGGGNAMMPPITGVRAGGLAAWGSLNINASSGAFAKPFGISPDIFYGLSDQLSLALVHSGYHATGFAGSTRDSLCLAGKADGCLKAYDRLAALARYALNGDLALDGGLVVNSLDAGTYAVKVGVVGRMPVGPGTLMYAPNVHVGVNKRDMGNKGALFVPISFMMPVSGAIMGGVQTGIAGPLDKFGDSYAVPVSFMGMMPINDTLMAGAALTFNNIAGKNSSADFRALNVFVGWKN